MIRRFASQCSILGICCGRCQLGYRGFHNRSFASSRSHSERVNETSFQPVLVRNFEGGWYAGLGDQAYTYDWRSKKFDLPLSARVGKVPKLGGQTVNVFAQPFYNIDHGSAGSQDYGLKVNLTFLLPDVRLGFPPASTDGSKGS